MIQQVARAGKSVSAAIAAAVEAGSSWYLAEFATATAAESLRDRSIARYGLRDAIAQPGVSTLPRVRKCGTPIGNSDVVLKHEESAGTYATGVETCASPWSCPVCAAKIRNHRAQEIIAGVRHHTKQGGGVLLVTYTLPHGTGDTLTNSLGVLKDAQRSMTQSASAKRERTRYGILGPISTYEITHGVNGWHPHVHQLVFTEKNLSRRAAIELRDSLQRRWDAALQRLGWQKSANHIGVRVDLVRRGAEAAAAYVAKLQEGERWDSNAANELARGDLKTGRKGSRTPFEIVADFLSTGNAADLDLWQEFEQATRGRSSIRWGRGLRELIMPEEEPELSDEEAAAADVGGTAVAVLAAWLYRQIKRRPYGVPLLMAAAEAGGLDGVRRWVRALGYDPAGVWEPHPSMSVTREAA